MIEITGSDLTVEKLVAVARNNEKVTLHPDALEQIKKCRDVLEKKLNAHEIPAGFRFSCTAFCVVDRHKRIETPRPHRPFSLLRVHYGSLFESVCCRQTSLSCSHPSGSGPRSLLSVTEAPGPIPTPSGPEQRQYRTLFNRLSIQLHGCNRPFDLPRRMRHSSSADSWCGRKGFRRT